MPDRQLPPQETWASGAAYEPFVGRWSRLVAREFVNWLKAPADSRWLEVGCGTGALSQAILDAAAPRRVTGLDRSVSYLAFAREHIHDARAEFAAGDAQALPVDTGRYEVVVTGLMLNFVPEPGRALAELARAARPGHCVAAYVWDYAGQMQLLRHFWEAAAAVDAAAAELDEGRRFPLCQPGPLRALWQEAGLRQVEVRPIEVATHFRDFEDYWAPFLGGQGPAPSYTRSLSADQRAAVRERLQAGLPFTQAGTIPLTARAWAIRGVR